MSVEGAGLGWVEGVVEELEDDSAEGMEGKVLSVGERLGESGSH